jgi:hypothetical protein
MQSNGDIRSVSGGTVRVPRGQLEKLENSVNGRLFSPGREGYEEARRVWNGLIDRRPALIVCCDGPQQVGRAVRFARDHEILFSIRGGGHNVAGSAIVDGGMTIDLSGMKEVEVDAERRLVRAAAGATLGDLDRMTQAHGLAVPVGLVSATGVAGLTLHGGLGWLARQHGLTADNLESVELVTAEGRPARASATENADLFWALQGGGGNFAAVTSFQFRAYPVGPKVWFAVTMYPAERASEVLAFFRGYMASASEQLGALAVFWSAPDIPEIPPEHRGAPVVILLACYTGPYEQGAAAIEPLRRVGMPLADLSGPTDFVEVQRFLDADYPDGGLYYWKSLYLDELGEEAVDTLSRYAAARPSPHSSIDVWALGGALRNGGSPLVSREAPFLLGIEANWHDAAASEANIAWARELHRDMQRFSRGVAYLNFPGFGEEGSLMLERAYGNNYRRLQEVKAKYDPDNIFRGQIPIEPAGTAG